MDIDTLLTIKELLEEKAEELAFQYKSACSNQYAAEDREDAENVEQYKKEVEYLTREKAKIGSALRQFSNVEWH